MASELRTFSYVVLVLVGNGGAGAHDLVRMMRRGRLYGEFAESQWYAEPKRLAALGYLIAHKEPGRTRERTRYELTDAGRAAIREWIARPTPFSRTQLEPAWRMLAADIVGEGPVLESLRGLRGEIDELESHIAQAEVIAQGLGDRGRYLAINHRLARGIIDAHRTWLDEVERELA